MKLLDILLTSNFEWVSELGLLAQDYNGRVFFFEEMPYSDGLVWHSLNDTRIEGICKLELAEDFDTTVIRKEDFLENQKNSKRFIASLVVHIGELERSEPVIVAAKDAYEARRLILESGSHSTVYWDTCLCMFTDDLLYYEVKNLRTINEEDFKVLSKYL